MEPDQRVSPDSFVYQEVARLYKIAQSLRPVAADRWNRELHATDLDTMGGLDPTTGALRLSNSRVLMHLTGSVSTERAVDQAEALCTVLHEATHGGMQIDAPTEPNAVRSAHSYGLTEGFAEVRSFADFDLFTERAGYGGLTPGIPQYPGAFAATRGLMAQVAGPAYTRKALIDDACRGPGVMHFDQFAHAVVANRLGELVQGNETDRRAIRRMLIQPMLHAHWPTLPKTSAETGQAVAEEIRSALDATVDELRQTYHFSGPAGGDQSTEGAPDRSTSPAGPDARTNGLDNLRFLQAQAPAAGAVGRQPTLGQGSRRSTPAQNYRGLPAHPHPRTRT